jgi:glycosyltransferase involved in cell wall biosynthesis
VGLISITIITPCYNENGTVIRFLEALEHAIAPLPFSFYVAVINDCSTDDTLALLQQFRFSSEKISLEIINLTFNAGHQAAIYQGLLYARGLASGHFIIMDADGEDTPSVIPQLLDHANTSIVNVVRGSRSEPLFFRLCYRLYKIIFRALTGKQMNYGNFCLINRPVLELAVTSRFSHFAAFLAKQNCDRTYILSKKGKRLGGKSKMGFTKLVDHALKSFIEYGADWKLLKLIQNHTSKTPIYEISPDGNTRASV